MDLAEFMVPTAVWSCVFVAAYFKTIPYLWITDIHALMVGTTALLSITENCDEQWTLYVTLPYFVLDMVWCVANQDWIFIAHHVVTLSAILMGLIYTPESYLRLRLASYMLLIEW